VLARIDAQMRRTEGRFRDQLPPVANLAADFAGLVLVAASVFLIATAGAAFWG
jgi:heme O synthase-like polyprenyltransferase